MGRLAIGDPSRFPRLLTGGLTIGWAFVLAIGQSWNFLYADDSLPFVVRVHQGQTHPHHLIIGFLATVNAWLGWVREEDFGRTLGLVRIFVSGMSLVGCLGIGYLAWLWFKRRWAVAAATVLAMVSYGFWAYSIVPDFYIPGIAAVIWAGIAVENFQCSGKWGWIGIAVVATWVAGLCHQSYFVFAVIATCVLLLNKQTKAAITFLTTTSGLAGVSYIIAFLGQQEYSSFWGFVRGYTAHMQFTPYEKLQVLTPLYALVGLVRSWTFPEYFVRLGTVSEWVESRYTLKLLLDDRFLLRHLPPEIAGILGGMGIVGVVLVGILLLIQAKRWHVKLRGRWSYWSLIGWGGVLLVLAVLWEPSSNEFWLWSVPLVALLLSDSRSSMEKCLWGLAGLGIAVATVPIIWLYRSPDNEIYSVNKRYRLHLQPEDIVIAADFHQTLALNWLYPTQARVLQYPLGRLEWDSNLHDALSELARPGSRGRLILDPMIVMPHRSEIALRQKLPGYEEEKILRILQQIASFCAWEDSVELYQQLEEIREELEGVRWHLSQLQADSNPEYGGELVQEELEEKVEELEERVAFLQRHLNERRRIPLLGVWRDGGGVVTFVMRSLPGLKWIK